MTGEKHGYVNVDELMRQVTFEQAAAYYGVSLPEIHRVGNEIRTRCFLNCGHNEQTGDRALAIQAEHPAKIWRCHQYGCGKGGNLVSLCDLMKPGSHSEGKPRGERFKAIIADLLAMTRGEPPLPSPATEGPPSSEPAPAPKRESRTNVPLAQSDNERARGLVNLDEKFIVDVANMNPKAASYFRSRPFLTPEVSKRWRMGYLPRDTGGDHAGGTMRGKIVYPMLAENGEVLTWFGRDPEYEVKHRLWAAGDKQDREPEKFHFVKGFHRGNELFGQHRFDEEEIREKLHGIGLVVVEGPNDVIALDVLGVPAVGLCSNTITDEQVEKIERLAETIAGGVVTLMLDCDEEGERGAKQAIVEIAQHCRVRLAWNLSMHGGAFKGRQPESLRPEEWETIRAVPDTRRSGGVKRSQSCPRRSAGSVPLCGRSPAWAGQCAGPHSRRPRAPAHCPPKIGEVRVVGQVLVRGLAGEASRVRSPHRGDFSSSASHFCVGSVRAWLRGRPRCGTRGFHEADSGLGDTVFHQE